MKPNLSEVYEDSDVEDYRRYKDSPSFTKKFWRGFWIAFIFSIPFWSFLGAWIYKQFLL
jgi:hypothetical protein